MKIADDIIDGVHRPEPIPVDEINKTPEDIAWERVHKSIDDDCDGMELTPTDAEIAWELGIAALSLVRDRNGQFPHDPEWSSGQ